MTGWPSVELRNPKLCRTDSATPDIRAADPRLHSTGALIGIAIAHRLPDITIAGNFGSSASTSADLFKASTGF
jgi:outer membrane protein TolC